MEHIDTLITARWVIPIEPDGRVLDDHAVAIHQRTHRRDRCRRDEALQRYSAAETIERPTHVLLPGFVNAHTHAAMTLLRGAAESSSLEHWLQRTRSGRSSSAGSTPSTCATAPSSRSRTC